MAISLKNKIVFITGASSGIGKACAEQFAQVGCALILTARRRERLTALANELQEKYQTKTLVIELDVTDSAAVNVAVQGLAAEWQAIDILINNAGVSLSKVGILSTDLEKIEETINTNVKGLLYITKAIVPQMQQKNSGHVINIGSVAAHYIFMGTNVYAATKYAVKAISQTLRTELLGTAIRVSQVDPGFVRTEIAMSRLGNDPERVKAFYDKIQSMTPDEIAEAVIFCATRNPHVNIDNIIVNNIDIAGTNINLKNEPIKNFYEN